MNNAAVEVGDVAVVVVVVVVVVVASEAPQWGGFDNVAMCNNDDEMM